tara:strand:+ start:164 stop:541 length:378 start_codon:yes stop_codon:yes gene_type:complete
VVKIAGKILITPLAKGFPRLDSHTATPIEADAATPLIMSVKNPTLFLPRGVGRCLRVAKKPINKPKNSATTPIANASIPLLVRVLKNIIESTAAAPQAERVVKVIRPKRIENFQLGINGGITRHR